MKNLNGAHRTYAYTGAVYTLFEVRQRTESERGRLQMSAQRPFFSPQRSAELPTER